MKKENYTYVIYTLIGSYFILQESDIEIDIGPRIQKHNTRSNDGKTDQPAAKRQKLCNELPSEKENASKETTPIPSDASAGEKNSNTKVNHT